MPCNIILYFLSLIVLYFLHSTSVLSFYNRRSLDTLYYNNNPWSCHYIKNTVKAAYVMSVYDLLCITVTSLWARWRLKSLASPLFTQPFIQEQIKENIKAQRYWPLCGEFTGDRLIPRTNGQLRRKCFHKMTSSWDNVLQQEHNGLCCHPSWFGSIYMFNTFVGNYILNQSRIKTCLSLSRCRCKTWEACRQEWLMGVNR